MANRRVHSVAGAAAGGMAAFLLARDQGTQHHLVEALGGVMGGRLPDLIEPALHPGHRSVAHALIPAGLTGTTVAPRLRRAQQAVRQWADRLLDAGTPMGLPLLA